MRREVYIIDTARGYMKLGGVREGMVYGTRGLDVWTWDTNERFLTLGSLPNPTYWRRLRQRL